MSLTIPPGFGLAAIEITSVQGTSPFITTCGVDLGEVGGDFVAAANNVFRAWSNAFIPTMGTAFLINRVILTVGSDGPSGSVVSTETPVPGVRSGTFGSVAQAVLANKVTNVLGRQGRGRMFIPGCLSQTEVNTSGIISAGSVTSFQTDVDQFYNSLIDGEGVTGVPTPPVLLHSAPSLSPTPVLAFQVSNKTGIIRKRIR